MRKVNLLFIITKLELGGAQKQLIELISQVNSARYNLFLISAQHGILADHPSAIKGLNFKKSLYLERPVNLFKDAAAIAEIASFIKKNKIDIVHTHSSKAGILGRLAAKLAKTSIVVHTVHGWPFHNYQSAITRSVYLWLERFAARFTDKLIVVSYHDSRVGLENKIGPQEKYRLIRYGINFSEFTSKDGNIRKELGLKDSEPLVGTVACFKPQKSLCDFVQAAYHVSQVCPGTKFIIAGDGYMRKEVEEQIMRYKLEKDIILLGWRKDIPRVVSSLDVFVLTSLWEGLPIAVLEAMASSVPVVATNTGGISEVIVDGKNGFLVTPRGIESLSQRVIALLKDEKLRRIIGGSASVSLPTDFRRENMVRKTEELYEELISRKLAHAN
jgi:glycosyltransferase involved in cell wall biosynthesis